MSLARELALLGDEVVLVEASDQLGGLAAPWHLGEVTWDRHYHVTLWSDIRTRAMYKAVGISDDDLIWNQTRTGYFGADQVLRSVSGPAEFLALPGLSPLDKVRLGATIAYGSQIRDGRRMERLGVERWLRRWSGDPAFETFWRPLLRAKLGDRYPDASASFIWATMRRLSAARRAGLGQERFGYVRGGYATVVDAFERTLADLSVEIRRSWPVTSIRPGEQGLEITPAGGPPETFDRVIVTTAAPLAARMCPDLLDGELRRLRSVDYVGIVCSSLLLDRPLADYYLTYITEPFSPITAVVEMTALVDPAELGGHHLVYLPRYTDPSDPWFTAPDDEVLREATEYLGRVHPEFRDDHVIAARVSRVPAVFALPTLGFSERQPSVSTSVPGLYLAGSANLPFATLNVDDTLSLVDRVLAELAKSDRTSVPSTPTEVR